MATAIERVQLEAIGLAIVSTIKEDGVAVNVSGAASMAMHFKKPDGNTVEKAAVLFTDGTDGKVQYLTEDGFLDVIGRWAVQAQVTWAGGFDGRSDIKYFQVMPNL